MVFFIILCRTVFLYIFFSINIERSKNQTIVIKRIRQVSQKKDFLIKRQFSMENNIHCFSGILTRGSSLSHSVCSRADNVKCRLSRFRHVLNFYWIFRFDSTHSIRKNCYRKFEMNFRLIRTIYISITEIQCE
jgi:hypothetical protein